MTPPLLTICIPTYNRAAHLNTLLHFLRSNVLDKPYEIEVVVVNNASADDTAGILEKHLHPRITTIEVEQHRPTAEENIIRSVDACHGEYVWFLGDDDVPVLENFDAHYRLLESNHHDFLLFNAAIADTNGNLSSIQNIKMNRPMIETPMASLVVTIGGLFTLAGVSNQIIRRRLLSAERGLHYLACSQIYSMVAWVIEAAKDARVAFVNAPLVYYRMNDYGDHWSRVATKMNVSDRHFWSIGLVDLLSELIKNNSLSREQVSRMMEVTADGSRVGTFDYIIAMFYQQLISKEAKLDPRQNFTPQQMAKASGFLTAVDTTSHDIVVALNELHRAVTEGRNDEAARQWFMKLYNPRAAEGLRARQIDRVCFGYEIIRTELAYVAIREGVAGLREDTLEYVDPLPAPPDVFVESDLESLLAKVERQATGSDQRTAAVARATGA
jgi:glycosyltransferase involved in cell wall biosynthesis